MEISSPSEVLLEDDIFAMMAGLAYVDIVIGLVPCFLACLLLLFRLFGDMLPPYRAYDGGKYDSRKDHPNRGRKFDMDSRSISQVYHLRCSELKCCDVCRHYFVLRSKLKLGQL
mmetsp:Transcript_26560/g.58301  ORF Transcript_26560/g.58301 Transcript_26560/m.58301 type:complete len:114 (+) Transcript_26560:27-368(+)